MIKLALFIMVFSKNCFFAKYAFRRLTQFHQERASPKKLHPGRNRHIIQFYCGIQTNNSAENC
jgi:hypothetical protein